jgi:hypothetical protein
MALTTHIIGMLAQVHPHQRKNAIREEQAPYFHPDPSGFNLDLEIPSSKDLLSSFLFPHSPLDS